jgi:putative ABC transport system ATP-binding protein
MRGVTKVYPGTPPVPALRGIDLEIRSGELVSVVGPSGSGKSTLLHIMGTLDRPTSGSVEVSGFDVGSMSDRQLSALRSQRLGFVFQQFHLLDAETALDNVADGLLYTGRPAAERREMAAATLERVGLADRMRQHASKLSGGERQRVAVARAVVGRPELVLADEPTGNLDSASSESIVELMEELNTEGITLVVITHNPEIAARFPRKVALRDGKVESDVASAAVGR